LSIFIAVIAFAEEDETIKFYDSYVETTKNAKSLDALKPYFAKTNLSQLGEITKEEETLFLEILKENRKTIKRKSISSKINGDTAILSIEAVDAINNDPIEGTVTLVKENGQWKFVQEEFISETVIE